MYNLTENLGKSKALRSRQEAFTNNTRIVHPLYQLEYKNAISCIKAFLSKTILMQAKYERKKALYSLAAEKCYSNTNNNYTYSEAHACEKLLFEKDIILSNIEKFNTEVEVRLQDDYEKTVLTHANNANFDEQAFELRNREWMLKVNYLYRYYYYFLARRIFLKYTNEEN